MRGPVMAAGLAAAALLVAAPAEAQREVRHQGFWIGAGLGGGWNTTKNVGATDEAQPGGAVYVRLGGTPSEKFLLGGEVAAWAREQDNETFTRGNVTATLLFYPSRNGGFFVKGGIGFASMDRTTTSGTVTTIESFEGAGSTLGIGYDVRVGRNFYITPNVDFLAQRITINSVAEENTLVLFTVGATWH